MEPPFPSMPEDPGEFATSSACDVAAASLEDLSPHHKIGSREELDRDFTEFLESRFRALLRYAYWVCNDRDLATDLVQDAAAKIYKVWGDEARRSNIKQQPSYVFTVVRSVFLDYRKVPSRTNERERTLAATGTRGIAEVAGRLDLETVWTVRKAVRQLDDGQRLMVFLVYYEGEGVSAAGRALGLNATQAHRTHSKALSQLRALLQEA